MGRSALEGMPPPPRTRDGRPSCNRAAMGVSGMQGSLGMDNKEEGGVRQGFEVADTASRSEAPGITR
jgi:hypothetical protein